MEWFDVRVDPDCVVWVSGDLDLATSPRFEAAMTGALRPRVELVVDLSSLAFMDSSGVRAILRTAMRTDAGVVLRRPTPAVRKVLSMTGIEGRAGIRVED